MIESEIRDRRSVWYLGMDGWMGKEDCCVEVETTLPYLTFP